MRSLLRLSPLALSLCAAVAACAPNDAAIAGAPSPIAGGMPEPGYPAVVAVYNSALMGLCTGTLIAPRVVLTAKHCVQNQGASSPAAASAFTIVIGPNINTPVATFSVQTVRTTPDPYNNTNDLVGVDIAVLTLTRAVTSTITPIPFRRDQPSDQVGHDVLVIGYGETPGGTAGTKYSGYTHVISVGGNEIYASGTTCHGDSGGPMLDSMGRVFGVTSYGFGSCGGGYDGHNGFWSPTLLAIIDAAIAEGAACSNDGPEVCDGHDNNCDGNIDEVCTPLGDVCDPSHDICFAGLPCVPNPITGVMLCTQTCSPLQPLVGCPMGLYCVQTAAHSCDGVCIPGHPPDAATAKPVGASCTDNTECATMLCIDPGDGTRRCLQSCQGDGGQCLADEACADVVGACNACVAASIVSGTRGVGETCAADADCDSHHCLNDLGVHYCTHDCAADADCPSVGYHCGSRPAPMGGVDQMLCVHGRREGIGGTCLSNGDCDPSASICAHRGDAYWCTSLCGTGTTDPMTHMPIMCPAGFVCTDSSGPGSPQLCVPSGHLVGESCTVPTDCISGTCTDGFCTRACNSETPCSTGTECVRAADGTATCRLPPPPPVVMPPHGGCSTSSAVGGNGVGALGVLFVLGLAFARRRRSVLSALAALGLVGCAAGPLPPEVLATSAAIAGGTFEPAYPAVVYILNSPGGGFGAGCTGSVIAPRVILTARHCVANFDRAGNPLNVVAPASNFQVYMGSSNRRVTEMHAVSDVRIASNTWNISDGSDVAVLLLATPTATTPIPYATGSPVELLGHPVTAVGFGQLPDGSSGTKYRVTAALEGVMEPFIEVSPSLCEGDSGGPALSFDGKIYGVASFITSPDGMSAPTCGSAPGVYTAIDSWVTSLIEPALRDTGMCLPRAETCNGLDDNCDGTIDEGCVAFGAACTDSSGCTSMNCATTSAGRLCTQVCDPLSPGLGCPPGFFCEREGGCDGLCVAGEAGAKGNGETCASSTECASLLCVDPGDGARRCLAPCRDDHGACASGEACAALPGDCGACVDAAIFPPPRHLGEPCATDADCASTHCQHDGEVAYCTRACAGDADCDVGYRCRTGFCHHGLPEGTGGPCASNEDCARPDVCASLGSRSWCTASCSGPSGCPMGYTCDPTVMVCAPALALVGEHCTGNADCTTGLCELGSGTCTRLCDVDQPCPTGFACDRAGTIAVCLRPPPAPPPRGGGCSVSRIVNAPAGVILLLAVALPALWGRRATRRLRRKRTAAG